MDGTERDWTELSGVGQNSAGLDRTEKGWAELSDIVCEGGGSTLAIGDVMVPEHGLRIASGFDDSYNLTPARLLRSALAWGTRTRACELQRRRPS